MSISKKIKNIMIIFVGLIVAVKYKVYGMVLNTEANTIGDPQPLYGVFDPIEKKIPVEKNFIEEKGGFSIVFIILFIGLFAVIIKNKNSKVKLIFGIMLVISIISFIVFLFS